MKVTYFTVEKINSGLFRTQVLDKIHSITSIDNSISFRVLAYNSPFDYFQNRSIIHTINQDFKGKLIIKQYPILPPLRYALKNIISTELVLIWLILFTKIFIKINSDIVHCRSYWPTIIATRVFQIPILFDLRSLFLAENVAAGKLILDSSVYKYWLKLEKECLEKAKVSTVVSKSMVDYVKKQSSNALVDLNPIVVNSQKIFFNSTQRELVRRQLNVENKLVFLYSGSLGMYGVNIPALVKLLKLISASFENAFFVFITGERNELVSSLLKKAGILKENSFITESKSHDLSEWLSTADFGIHALPKQLDSSTRLGTKVVEYWVAGLPTIVNKYVGAAAQITEEYQIGFVVHDEFKLSSEEVKSILDLLEMDRNKIREIAMDIFDSRVVAQKYINSYTKCLK